MINNNVIDMLKETGALQEGHFLLSSGRHSKRYCQCAKLLQYPDKAERVISRITKQIEDMHVDAVIGPAMGGIIVAYEIGKQIGRPAMFTERVNGIMELRRSFEINKGEKILIAEDVVTTGKSSYETAQLVKGYGGEVVGIACIVDRSIEKIEYPVFSAVKFEIETYEPENCPLCKSNIPFIKPGSRNLKK